MIYTLIVDNFRLTNRHDHVAKFLYQKGAKLVMLGNSGGVLMCKVRVEESHALFNDLNCWYYSSKSLNDGRLPIGVISLRSSDLSRMMFHQVHATMMVELHW